MQLGFTGVCLGVVKKTGVKDPNKNYYSVKLDQRGSAESVTIPCAENVALDFLSIYENDVEYHRCNCILEYSPGKQYNPMILTSITLTDR